MLDLTKHIARDIAEDERLTYVPLPVIEEVLRIGIARLAEIVPVECDASALDEIKFECCESCEQLVEPEKPQGAVRGGDGSWVCYACREEGGLTAAPVPGSKTP
jgi:hypothetical protein